MKQSEKDRIKRDKLLAYYQQQADMSLKSMKAGAELGRRLNIIKGKVVSDFKGPKGKGKKEQWYAERVELLKPRCLWELSSEELQKLEIPGYQRIIYDTKANLDADQIGEVELKDGDDQIMIPAYIERLDKSSGTWDYTTDHLYRDYIEEKERLKMRLFLETKGQEQDQYDESNGIRRVRHIEIGGEYVPVEALLDDKQTKAADDRESARHSSKNKLYDDIEDKENRTRLLRLYKKAGLTLNQGQACLLRDYEGYTFPQMGEILGITDEAAKKRSKMGRIKLEKYLKNNPNVANGIRSYT